MENGHILRTRIGIFDAHFLKPCPCALAPLIVFFFLIATDFASLPFNDEIFLSHLCAAGRFRDEMAV